MNVGDWIHTPRFLNVQIAEILTPEEAEAKGYREPTHYYSNPDYDIRGKSIGINRMEFAAVRKDRRENRQ